MRQRFTYITILLGIFLFPVFSLAQSLTATVNKKEAAVNERISLVFTINGDASDFKAPKGLYQDFKVNGPSQGSNYSNYNGRISITTTYEYEIRPKRQGNVTIGSASAKADGKTITSKPITIQVVPASQRKQDPNSPEALAEKYSSFKILVKPREVYVGEPISVMFKAYNKSAWENLNYPKEPEYSGFTREDFIKEAKVQQEVIDGQRQNTALMRHFLLFPQKAQVFPKQTIGFDLVTGVPSGRRNMWGEQQLRGVEHTLYARFPEIKVKPLPSGAPNSFTGAVGTFSFKVELSRNELKADESATLTVSIKGKGNTKFVELPKVTIPDDLETYDPKYKEKINLQTYGYDGYKKDEYLLIPRYKGNYIIPSIAFSFFDPVKEEYVTIKSDPLELSVLEGPENKATTSNIINKNTSKKENIEALGSDILFIKTEDSSLQTKSTGFVGSTFFYVLVVLSLLGLTLPWLIFGVGKKLRGIQVSEKSKMSKAIKEQLKLAEKAQKSNDSKALLEHADQALLLAFEKACAVSKADLNKNLIEDKLKQKGVETSIIVESLSLLSKIEMARFAPMQKSEEGALLKSTQEIIEKLNA